MTDMPEEIYAGKSNEYGCFWNNAHQLTGGEITTKYIRADLVPQWQDISTAPKDGTEILLQGKAVPPHEGRYVTVGYGFDDGWRTYQGLLTNQPTRWMPLPEPPKEIK
jgi:hypothetical protein